MVWSGREILPAASGRRVESWVRLRKDIAIVAIGTEECRLEVEEYVYVVPSGCTRSNQK